MLGGIDRDPSPSDKAKLASMVDFGTLASNNFGTFRVDESIDSDDEQEKFINLRLDFDVRQSLALKVARPGGANGAIFIGLTVHTIQDDDEEDSPLQTAPAFDTDEIAAIEAADGATGDAGSAGRAADALAPPSAALAHLDKGGTTPALAIPTILLSPPPELGSPNGESNQKSAAAPTATAPASSSSSSSVAAAAASATKETTVSPSTSPPSVGSPATSPTTPNVTEPTSPKPSLQSQSSIAGIAPHHRSKVHNKRIRITSKYPEGPIRGTAARRVT